MPEKQTEPGYFQWNSGAWFGGQLGATAWLAVGAGVLASQSGAMAAIWLTCFLIANAIGTLLWRNRGRIRPYPAIQWLLLVSGVCGLIAWSSLTVNHPDLAKHLNLAGADPRRGYFAFLIVPALMAWFALLQYGAKRQALSK
jgi:FtsH-binding integral membrane protein